eukprot:TRINITY_DN4479_c0_g1_i2.p1 TRINITY_DN4479_c0_g1~~TRINITY_DN4479_c0_g1_i2.p1  ORF type:complete len:505 (+),score=130.56 TRINITY_DN4479_c0_g1_i2:183-1697(+)
MARLGALRASSLVPVAAQTCLLLFTGVLLLKIDRQISTSWWCVFVPLWCFHGVVARCKCSIPAPNTINDRQWAPCHSVVAPPLVLAFEILLCCYLAALEGKGHKPPMHLAVVFVPIILLQVIILLDNFRMCMVLMPGEEDNMTDEALWETLPHFAIAVSMVFFLAATAFTVLKLAGNIDVLDWWDLVVNFCIGEFFAFLLCIRWTNPLVASPPSRSTAADAALGASGSTTPLLGSSSGNREGGTWDSSTAAGGSSPSGPAGGVERVISNAASSHGDDDFGELACGMPEFGGHVMKAALICFQILVCMRLEREPEWVMDLPLVVIFSPLLLVQGLLLLSSLITLLQNVLICYGSEWGRMLANFMQEYDPSGLVTRGMRLAGWWSMDEEIKEERHGLSSSFFPGYSTFEATPPAHVKRMRKGELAEEVVRLQAALVDQAESSKLQRQELDRVQQEKVLCRVCFERDISLVLMPCRHRVLCTWCAEKCKQCPICRSTIIERMAVFSV